MDKKLLDIDVILGLKEPEELKPKLSVFDELIQEVFKDLENVMWNLARNTKIPGYDADDLMQEMRIKVVDTLKNNNYDPDKCKPTSFYYRVCKNCLINLNASKIYKYKNSKPQNRNYRDYLDQKCADIDEILPKVGEIPLNFVQNFSESFAELVLPTEEIKDEERRNTKV